ncbi:hypothetical protein ACINWC743_A0285 [Acinetobacter sp. WC-743]|nr:hypothetical protein ACINWC743_A0285 [Acinetobacter sp. WC-743]
MKILIANWRQTQRIKALPIRVHHATLYAERPTLSKDFSYAQATGH